MKIKKISYIVFFFFISFNIFSQDIKVNENKFTTIIFESNISSGIISNDDYFFEYNESQSDNIALLKANKKTNKPTSLVVRTENGTLFNINVSYGISTNIIMIADSLGFNTNIVSNSYIKDEVNPNIIIESKNESFTNNSIKEDDYTIGNTIINDKVNISPVCDECLKILESKKSIKRIFDETFKIKLQLNNVYYKNGKLYFVINFINSSDLDYNINYIKSYVNTGNDSKSSSNQYLEKYPTSIYNSNRSIKGSSERVFIFVYDQFTIDNFKKLTFEVNENNGERNLALQIPHYLINNPKKIK